MMLYYYTAVKLAMMLFECQWETKWRHSRHSALLFAPLSLISLTAWNVLSGVLLSHEAIRSFLSSEKLRRLFFKAAYRCRDSCWYGGANWLAARWSVLLVATPGQIREAVRGSLMIALPLYGPLRMLSSINICKQEICSLTWESCNPGTCVFRD